MARVRNDKQAKNPLGINLRVLKKEIKMIPFDIKKEMRLLDLLFNEKVTSRTQVERDVLLELIEKARNMIKIHQDKLDRFQKLYNQMRLGNNSEAELLTAEEVHTLQRESSRASIKKKEDIPKVHLRTGTHG